MADMYKIFCSLFLLLTSIHSLAQSTVTGQLVDANKKPVAFATVLLATPTDTAMVQAMLSDAAGAFRFEGVATGTYRLVVSSVGYLKLIAEPFALTSTSLTLPPTQLITDVRQLNEVTVSARKSFLEQQPDKLVVNVSASPIATGATALEVLRKVPGVQVRNDRISIVGKNSVAILIDGKPSPYTDMNAVVREIPSSSIESIEVITNPSARYDAAGGAVINLILKRGGLRGTNGTVSLMAGGGLYNQGDVNRATQTYPRLSPSLTMNHRAGRWNVFGSYSYFYRSAFEINQIQRNYGASVYNQKNYNPAPYGIHNYRVGADYYLGNKNTVGLLLTGFDRAGAGTFENQTQVSNRVSGQLTDAFTSRNQQQIRRANQTLNANWTHRFDSTGRLLTIDLDLARYTLTNRSAITVTPRVGRPTLNTQAVTQPVDFRTIKIDYVHPFSPAVKLELGAKVGAARIDNDLSFEVDGVRDTQNSNRFIYDEQINAAYANLSTKKGRWTAQVGLRAEQTVAKGRIGSDLVLDRNYWQPFPSLFLTRQLDSSLAIIAQYSRRIDRPGFTLQNPFQIYIDPLTYTRGNPLLRPQLTNAYKLGLTYTNLPVLTVSYDLTSDVIFELAPQQEQRTDANGNTRLVTYTVAQNLAEARNFTVQLNFPIQLGKVIDGYGGAMLVNQRYRATYLGQAFDRAKWYGVYYTEINVKLSPATSFQLTGYYAAPALFELALTGRNSSVDLALEHRFWRKQAKLTLAMSDLLYMDRTIGTIQFDDIDFSLNQRNDTRTARLTFSYSFGSQWVKSSRTRSTASEAESRRVK
jgi:hypothetical protein